MSGKGNEETIETQFQKLRDSIKKILGEEGRYYVYVTVDKNDFIVCIRGRKHKNVLLAIKSLHNTGSRVVYSYSVMSIKKTVLEELNPDKYSDIYNDNIDSICFKGVTNSQRGTSDIPLDKRYRDFCERLVELIYSEKKGDYKIYDILGDEDFRLIARGVNLGLLLEQYKKGGMLAYDEGEFCFFLFSSSLVLNTLPTLPYEALSDSEKKLLVENTNILSETPLCDALEGTMSTINGILSEKETVKCNDKILTFCHALWQLLQSLKPLEKAPTKRYDFYSLYKPFSALVRILEKKLQQEFEGELKNLEENRAIYNYIYKIGITLHGSFRTDIQFFQMQDFSAIMHYTPAKLRAFYSYWTFAVADFYNDFAREVHQYSFIFSSGMFHAVNVEQLFKQQGESERLMLITTPERLVYMPQWMLLKIGHEVAHFVGTDLRERELRQEVWLNAIVREMQLEGGYYTLEKMSSVNLENECQQIIAEDTEFYDKFKAELVILMNTKEKTDFHTEASMESIRRTLKQYGKIHLKRIMAETCTNLRDALVKKAKTRKILSLGMEWKITDICRELVTPLCHLYEKYEYSALDDVMNILHYYTSESQADIVAILTMGISPKAYIESFTKNENILESVQMNGEVCMSVGRIGIVLQVIQDIVENETKYLKKIDKVFVKEWSEQVKLKIPNKRSGKKQSCGLKSKLLECFPKDSDEYKLALLAIGYLKNVRNCQDNITKFRKIYNSNPEECTFSNRVVDFINDRYIYNELCRYGKACAKKYICFLKKFPELVQKREHIVEIYRKFAGNSIMDAIQKMEESMNDYEKQEFGR